MSFRRDDQGRYGQVPPVQYAVGSQAQSSTPAGRRPSFNTGDDGAYHSQNSHYTPSSNNAGLGVRTDELFLTDPAQRSPSRRPLPTVNSNALSGYQHQYQDSSPSTPSLSSYNPQNYMNQNNYQQNQAPGLPYHNHPTRTYSTNPPSGYPTAQSPPQTYPHQSYNPAAYAAATSPQRQPTYAPHPTSETAYGYTPAAAVPNSGTYHPQSPANYSSPFSQTSPAPYAGGWGHLPTSQTVYAGMQTQQPTYSPQGYYPARTASISNNQAPVPSAAANAQGVYSPDSQISDEHTQFHGNHHSYYERQSRSGSHSSATSPQAQNQTSPVLQRHPTNAPLPRRPADGGLGGGERWAVNGHSQYDDPYSDARQDSLLQDIEQELRGTAGRDSHSSHSRTNSGRPSGTTSSVNRYGSTATRYDESVSRSSSGKMYESEDGDVDEDDLGTAGVEAMRRAEEEERRFSVNTSASALTRPVSSIPPPSPEEQYDFGTNVDLSMLSGGYAGNLTYGNDVGSPPDRYSSLPSTRPLPSAPDGVQTHQSPRAGFETAEVDYAGTGGLQAPIPHRLSYDEGREERMSTHSGQSGSDSPTKAGYQDLFYHPGLTNRPLPALPPGSISRSDSESNSLLSPIHATSSHRYSNSFDSSRALPQGPESFYDTSGTQYNQHPERSISLSGHSNTPQIITPARSRTDATEERKKLARANGGVLPTGSSTTASDASTPVGAFDGITLPSGRKRKFVPSKLSSGDFRRCREPWAVSGIVAWLREMAEGEPDLREKTVEEALIHLFTAKVTTMNVADAEVLAHAVVANMLNANVLVPDEEWVKFGDGNLSGVLWQMTGTGCYAPKLHEQEISGRCYSHHCTRTLKKLDLDGIDDSRPTDEWHIFYGLQKEDWESKDRKEVDRQNILHEIVTGEKNYIQQLDIFRTLYRDELRMLKPPIINADRRDKFLNAVFGKLDTVIEINKENLLAQLKYRQQEQGPWIIGFSDIFREWIRKAKADYIEYATTYPRATWMVRKEAERNIYFKKFLEEQQKHKSSSKQDWTHFLIAPLQRLQRYILLLESVEHKMREESEEKTNLLKAIEEIKAVTHECDAKVEETNKRVEMMELNRMLVLRPGFQSVLNLDHLGRELIIQGDLTRMGSRGVRWVDTHALLFDHYLILAKEVSSKDGRGEKKYDVSREPIPMPLLFLESINEEPVLKQKGITAPLGRTTAAASSSNQLNKVATNNSSRPALEHAPTGSSVSSPGMASPALPSEEGKILYPFRIKHLGHEVYTLYASSARDRSDWATKIIEAKTRHAKALYQQNAEPFRLRVLADAAFNYDAASLFSRLQSVPVKETPLDRAIQDIEGILGSAQGIAPICRAQVNCAAGFSAFGKQVVVIGTDYGVYISEPSNPRGWTRTVQANRVTQIAVLEEFSICLLIADRSLISYPLEVIAPVSEFAAGVQDNPRKAPQRLAKDVTYLATAKMKERTLVFYKRREGLHTSFKVLEPVLHKAADKKSRFGIRKAGIGSTESFRDYDEFFFPSECYSLSLFQTYIAVATSKGFELLTLDKKQTFSVPDVKQAPIANIAGRIKDQKPLGMFRLNENEFLLTYEDCAVYVDKHGDVSRTLIMEYTGKQKKARGATMYGKYLLLVNDDYVEVRNAENGRLRQIIAGRDVRLIDYGVRGPTGGNALQQSHHYGTNGLSPSASNPSKGTVKIAMSHPELPGRQVLLEMLLNDGHTES